MSKDYKMRGFDSYDLSGESFTHDKPVEAFSSRQSTVSSCQQPALAIARSSFSSTSNETCQLQIFWIREEDNREETASSFSGLGLYSPQLVHPTKARAKAPRTRRPRKNKSNNASKRAETENDMGFEATGSSFRGKEPLGDTRKAGPRDSSKESTSCSRAKDKVRNLRARFEQMRN